MAAHNDYGTAAERLAAEWLEERGWTVVARNWRWRHREIDLIVRRGAVTAFVEVRARRSLAHGHPFETIGRLKRRDLELAARAWIAWHGNARDEYRFDAIAVVAAAGAPDGDREAPGSVRLEHLEGAWLC